MLPRFLLQCSNVSPHFRQVGGAMLHQRLPLRFIFINKTSINDKLIGQSGREYLIEKVLQAKKTPPSNVYLAT